SSTATVARARAERSSRFAFSLLVISKPPSHPFAAPSRGFLTRLRPSSFVSVVTNSLSVFASSVFFSSNFPRSRPLRRHDDDPRAFRQFHRGIERTYQAVLHDTRHGQGAPAKPAKVSLHGRRN